MFTSMECLVSSFGGGDQCIDFDENGWRWSEETCKSVAMAFVLSKIIDLAINGSTTCRRLLFCSFSFVLLSSRPFWRCRFIFIYFEFQFFFSLLIYNAFKCDAFTITHVTHKHIVHTRILLSHFVNQNLVRTSNNFNWPKLNFLLFYLLHRSNENEEKNIVRRATQMNCFDDAFAWNMENKERERAHNCNFMEFFFLKMHDRRRNARNGTK